MTGISLKKMMLVMISILILIVVYLGPIQSLGQNDGPAFAQDNDLADAIMSTAIGDHPSVNKRYQVVGRIDDGAEVDMWFSRLYDLWGEGLIPIPVGSPEEYAFSVYEVEPKTYLEDNEIIRGEGTIILILAGENLGPDIHNSRTYHWAGIFAFNRTGQNVGYGWWSVCPRRFKQIYNGGG